MLGNLRQLECVGRGATAEVFRGEMMGEHGIARPVAIKRLRSEAAVHPEIVDLFVNEARIAVRLNHPNLVQAFELNRDSEGYALVYEWIEGMSLEELHTQVHDVPWFVVAYIGIQIAAGLESLHHVHNANQQPMNLVHRDVSPSNTLLTSTGIAKLADYGVAWCQGQSVSEITFAANPDFAPPEQLEKQPIDQRADIFGLGATLRFISNDIPEPLAQVLNNACAQDPNQRWAHAAALQHALQQILEQAGKTQEAHTWLVTTLQHLPAPSRACLDQAVQSILGEPSALPVEIIQHPNQQRTTKRFWIPISMVLTILVGVSAYGIWQTNLFFSKKPIVQPVEDQKPIPWSSMDGVIDSTEPLAPQVQPKTTIQREFSKNLAFPTKPSGQANINAVPWALVRIDGQAMGHTPIRAITLPAGLHHLVFVHPPDQLERKVDLEIQPNMLHTLVIHLRTNTFTKRVERVTE